MAASKLEKYNFNLVFYFICKRTGTEVGSSAYVGAGSNSRAYRNNSVQWCRGGGTPLRYLLRFPFEVHPTNGLIPRPEVGRVFPLWQAGAEVFGSCSLQKKMERDYI